MGDHHASCKPHDQQLVYFCNQCGNREDASFKEDKLQSQSALIKRLVEALKESLKIMNIVKNKIPTELFYTIEKAIKSASEEVGD